MWSCGDRAHQYHPDGEASPTDPFRRPSEAVGPSFLRGPLSLYKPRSCHNPRSCHKSNPFLTMVTSDQTLLDEGIYTPVPTFYTPEGEIDLDTQVQHAQFLHQGGVNGLVVCGSMGEAINLTRDERVATVLAVRQAIGDPKFKIIAGTPPCGVKDTVEEISQYHQVGADFAIVLAPGYYGPRLVAQSGIVDYFTAVADQSKLPVIIYNFPGVSNGVDMDVDTFVALLNHPQLAGVKITHVNMDKYIAIMGKLRQAGVHNRFRAFTGLGQILVPSMAVGAFGAIDGLSGVFPKSMVKLFELYKQGKLEEANELQAIVTEANNMVLNLNLVGIKTALSKYYGWGKTVVGRAPLNVAIDAKVWAKYEPALKVLEETEKSL